ncbi:mitochondrial protein cyt-4 [Xylariaceae sp. AK1471]|nr:mitochondrial protein cyt-4 [Xylariaceae sp. AK1471]
MMLQASNRSYVCWRCAARRLGPGLGPGPLFLRSSTSSSLTGTLCKAPSRRGLATVQHQWLKYDGSDTSSSTQLESARKAPIRERLRRWEEENPTQGEMMLGDFAVGGGLANNLTRPQNVTMVSIEVEDSSPMFTGDELVDLRSDDAMLDPGDLVEISSEASRRPVLAICLGRINGYEHFYTVSGKWFSAMGIKTLFVVNKFATPEELKPVIAALPPSETPIQDLNILQDLGEGPSRAAGAVLLRKMLLFTQGAEAVYQANAGTLDASSAFIGDPVKHRYLTLHEIADLLLPEKLKRDGKFGIHALYAVHRALLQDEVFFRPLRHTGHKRSYLFEVSPLSEVRLIQKVEKIVRDYMDQQGNYKSTQSTAGSPVESFVSNAQRIIDASRKNREWSQTGIIGPSSKAPRVEPDWSTTDLEILQFIELWASYQKFPLYSRLQTLGSTLLRAVDRYQEAQGYLPVTGWSFLQEIGWIPPWEIPARYNVRFPGVDIKRGGSYVRPFLGMLDRHLKQDALSLIRKPLNGVTAYCIDDITAHEIDDAVSLERTKSPEEYWIHVHVADPTSSFGADTPVAKYAELIPEAIYLPGHLEPMLPESIIHDHFSLAPNRPCLTFSALVNTHGTVLKEKITANTLEDVVYMTYEDAASAIGEIRKDPFAGGAQWSLGTAPKAKTANRKMTRPEDLTEDQKSDLDILSKLGKSIQAGRLEKGATPFFQPRPMATTDFDGVKQKESKNFIAVSGDPLIHVHYSRPSGTDLVENAMKLANEVAARWCYERGIPIPYRTQPHALRNAALVQQYARDVLNPMLSSGGRPDDSVWRHMRSLLGVDEVSTTPGPHFTLGTDMYTKATSPLRRFGDLIVHWQIEAALLEEKRLGCSLVSDKGNKKGDTDLSFLPFTRDRLDRMLPMLRLREKQARTLTNADGADQWILQALVRAWRFKEAPLPETFKMTVFHLSRSRILGRLDWFERPATLKHDALNNITIGANVRIGDVIEVRLTDVNIQSKQIFVEAVRVLEKAEDKKQVTQVPSASVEVNDMPIETT